MSIDDLLKPRYKVIAEYPGNTFRIGLILNADTKREEKQYSTFPHLFRKLEWWEEREEKDMPNFIKWNVGKRQVQKSKFDFKKDALYLDGIISTFSMWKECIEPATLEEYNTYLKQLKST